MSGSGTSAQWQAPGKQAVIGYPNRRARLGGLFFTAVWLLYLIQPVANLFKGGHSALYIGVGLAIMLVFCAIYLIFVPLWPLSPRYALSSLAALAALAAAACLFYGGSGGATTQLWIFVSSAAGLLSPTPRRALLAVLTASAGYGIFSWSGHVHRTDFLVNLLPTIFVGLATISLRRQFTLTAELSRARAEVETLAANEERLRLARDLHDLTGQSLSMVTLKSELAARLLRRLPECADRDRAIAETEEVAAVSRQTLQDIREAVSGYRRPTLAVEMITGRTALESAGITPHDDVDLIAASGTFDPDAEAALAWCLREAITNVIRHSGARNCHVSVARRDGGLSLKVRDDGAGYRAGAAGSDTKPGDTKPGDTKPSDTKPTGTGLRGMSERLSAVGGHLEVRPSGDGFCLVATV